MATLGSVCPNPRSRTEMNFFLTIDDSQPGHQMIPLTAEEGTKVGNLLELHMVKSHLFLRSNGAAGTEKHSDDDFYTLCNGKRLEKDTPVEDGRVYHIVPRVLGGKGGFGSMLRCIGAQIEKTTSREACRDLSGRRMRDINNEKKLKEWLAKEADREKEKEERRAQRLARRLDPPKHKFEDSEYQEQKLKVQENLEDALQTGLKRALKKTNGSSAGGPSDPKRLKLNGKEWLGVELSSDDDSDTEANPGSASPETPPEISSTPAAHSPGRSPQPQSSDSDQASPETELKVEENCNTPEPDAKETTAPTKPTPSEQGKDKMKPVEEADIEVTPQEAVDLGNYCSASSLCELGLERLKTELMSRGLKCGGTLEERASRLFSVQGLEPEDYPPSIIAKAKGKGKKSK